MKKVDETINLVVRRSKAEQLNLSYSWYYNIGEHASYDHNGHTGCAIS